MDGNKKKTTRVVNDEVEELLRAAEDAALLKLNLNSHTVHASPSDLHPDLDQRFRALKSGSKSAAKPETSTKRMPPPQTGIVKEELEEDDLFVRFSALKASLPNSSVSSSSVGANTSAARLVQDVSKLGGGGLVGEGNIDDEDEDEVDKVIRWAMDAARLDPSLSSDDDDNINDDDEKSDEDDDSPGRNKKGHHK